MSTTIQCHQPEPVGASGSYTVTAKLLVPSGAPLHCKTGDWLLPPQPNMSDSKLAAIAPPAGTSGLVKLKVLMGQAPYQTFQVCPSIRAWQAWRYGVIWLRECKARRESRKFMLSAPTGVFCLKRLLSTLSSSPCVFCSPCFCPSRCSSPSAALSLVCC